jgi:hypothetical protein
LDSFFVDFAKFTERNHLESSGIGENVPVPTHELMKAADFGEELLSGKVGEVIGVGEEDSAVEIFHLA